jgi:hypothetical protein
VKPNVIATAHLPQQLAVIAVRSRKNDIKDYVRSVQRDERRDDATRNVGRIRTTKRYEDSANPAGTRTGAGSKLGVNWLKQGEFRPQQGLTSRGHAIGVAGFPRRCDVLIEEQIAIVPSIGQVIDDHQPLHERTHGALPPVIDPVVVDDHPLGHLCA